MVVLINLFHVKWKNGIVVLIFNEHETIPLGKKGNYGNTVFAI